ncbi:MAG TPA: hypothetical protein VGI03_08030 [Verrucomicrobiae bacterium]
MKSIGKIAVCLAGGLACSITLRAEVLVASNTAAGSPYTPIVERNVFGLLPPPAPVDPNAATAADLPKITANGIMNVFGNLKVLFKASGKPGSKDSYYDLAEGQSEDGFEVVKIDENAQTVTFKNNGTEQHIPLVTVTTGGGAGGGGGGGGMQAGFGGGHAPGFPGSYGGGGNGGFANHSTNPGYPGGYTGQSSGNNGNNGFNNGGFSGGMNGGNNGTMGLSFNGPGSQNRTINPSAGTQPMSPETQQFLIYANKTQMIKNGDPNAAIMPPTEVENLANGSGDGN